MRMLKLDQKLSKNTLKIIFTVSIFLSITTVSANNNNMNEATLNSTLHQFAIQEYNLGNKLAKQGFNAIALAQADKNFSAGVADRAADSYAKAAQHMDTAEKHFQSMDRADPANSNYYQNKAKQAAHLKAYYNSMASYYKNRAQQK